MSDGSSLGSPSPKQKRFWDGSPPVPTTYIVDHRGIVPSERWLQQVLSLLQAATKLHIPKALSLEEKSVSTPTIILVYSGSHASLSLFCLADAHLLD